MKISDLPEDKVVVGLRIKGLDSGVLGTIIRIDEEHDRLAWVKWDDGRPPSGFYGNDCSCEVVGHL